MNKFLISSIAFSLASLVSFNELGDISDSRADNIDYKAKFETSQALIEKLGAALVDAKQIIKQLKKEGESNG